MSIADTLIDISHESSLKKPEKVSLRRIAKEVKELEVEVERLQELLQSALPHIECKNNSQSGLITEIGEYLEQALA